MRDDLALKMFSAKSISTLLNQMETKGDIHAIIYFILLYPLTLMFTQISSKGLKMIFHVCLKALLTIYDTVASFITIETK